MQSTKIFLASSSELEDERREFEIFIGRKNREWQRRGVFLELVVWEDFLDSVSPTRLQDEYNAAIRDCDVFMMLFCTKVGKYSEEEFDTALARFKATGKPLIFTYFKDQRISTGGATPQEQRDLISLWAFQDKLKALGHFPTVYKNSEALLLHFSQQLEKLAANGSIKFERDANPDDAAGDAGDQATLDGDGAIAQGERAVAVGSHGVYVGGNNIGQIGA